MTKVKQNLFSFVIFVIKLIAQGHVGIFPAFAPNMEIRYQCITARRPTKTGPSLRNFIRYVYTLCLAVDSPRTAAVKANEVLAAPMEHVFRQRENGTCGILHLGQALRDILLQFPGLDGVVANVFVDSPFVDQASNTTLKTGANQGKSFGRTDFLSTVLPTPVEKQYFSC